MKIIGLTGGIACGKTTVADMLRSMGASVVDADKITRQLQLPGGEALPALLEAFGSFVFSPDGTLNRENLAALVFSNEADRKRLNDIMHPLIRKHMEEQIETSRKMGALVVVLDVPLLFEAGVEDMADIVVCATAPEEVQIERLKTRSGLSRELALQRIHSQMPLDEKALRSDIVLPTDRPAHELELEVHKLYDSWTKDEA